MLRNIQQQLSIYVDKCAKRAKRDTCRAKKLKLKAKFVKKVIWSELFSLFCLKCCFDLTKRVTVYCRIYRCCCLRVNLFCLQGIQALWFLGGLLFSANTPHFFAISTPFVFVTLLRCRPLFFFFFCLCFSVYFTLFQVFVGIFKYFHILFSACLSTFESLHATSIPVISSPISTTFQLWYVVMGKNRAQNADNRVQKNTKKQIQLNHNITCDRQNIKTTTTLIIRYLNLLLMNCTLICWVSFILFGCCVLVWRSSQVPLLVVVFHVVCLQQLASCY